MADSVQRFSKRNQNRCRTISHWLAGRRFTNCPPCEFCARTTLWSMSYSATRERRSNITTLVDWLPNCMHAPVHRLGLQYLLRLISMKCHRRKSIVILGLLNNDASQCIEHKGKWIAIPRMLFFLQLCGLIGGYIALQCIRNIREKRYWHSSQEKRDATDKICAYTFSTLNLCVRCLICWW